MKREIKFRGKRINDSGWIYGMPTYDFKYIFNGEQLDSYDNYEVTPGTVGQFTTLKDKNGVEIYRDDKFQYHEHEGYILPNFTGEILFMDGCFGYVATSENMGEAFHPFSEFNELKEDFLDHVEITGNIHDNPELLK